MWGGRYAAGPSAIMMAINASISFDKKLALYDIEGSLAHAAMLGAKNIISADDVAKITAGLNTIREQIKAGDFAFTEALEDVHMNIEHHLTLAIGDAGRRLHTGRSRNDQVATDFKLWMRDAFDYLDAQLKALQAALISQAEQHTETVMPGLTHFQIAQPVSFAHHLMAYVEMLGRDRDRVLGARKRANECPLGAAALAGTPYPIDRAMTAKTLGFDRPTANSLDSVSDRDFVMDYASTASITMVHLSRLAEEIILWMNPQIGFVTLGDQLTTGSSIMPQKRNPDAAELVRGKTGRVFGVLMQMLTLLKALPLAYAKDLQEDKEQTFMVAETLDLALSAMTAMVLDIKVNKAAMQYAATLGFSTATDLADWLVRELKLPFRDAHHVTGKIVKLAEDKNVQLHEIPLQDMQSVEPRITANIFDVLSVEASMKSRTSFGGTAPVMVKAAISDAKKRFW
ncbi:MAG: argininosuccinate lyase [Alphaproteobacteria bacterium]|nr:argininosuccinate lyase [Alphaproteobacteria bacterium]